MGNATSVADNPRLTAVGASLTRFEEPLRGLAAAFFFAAMVVLSGFVAKDDARAARVTEIGPGPVDEHDDPVAEADQEEHVHEQPEQPRGRAREAELRQLNDGGVAADRRE